MEVSSYMKENERTNLKIVYRFVDPRDYIYH